MSNNIVIIIILSLLIIALIIYLVVKKTQEPKLTEAYPTSFWISPPTEKLVTFTATTPFEPKTNPSSYFEWIYRTGGSWSIPRLSLPACLGSLSQYQTEYWVHFGVLETEQGEQFTFNFYIGRFNLPLTYKEGDNDKIFNNFIQVYQLSSSLGKSYKGKKPNEFIFSSSVAF